MRMPLRQLVLPLALLLVATTAAFAYGGGGGGPDDCFMLDDLIAECRTGPGAPAPLAATSDVGWVDSGRDDCAAGYVCADWIDQYGVAVTSCCIEPGGLLDQKNLSYCSDPDIIQLIRSR